MARLNLTIPDPLYERLERLRDRVNVSKVCAIALAKELDMLEGNATLAVNLKAQRMVERLQARKDRWFQRGYEDGGDWAADLAALQEIRDVVEEWELDDDETYEYHDVDFPESFDAEAALERCRKMEREEGRLRAGEDVIATDQDSYVRGWFSAVKDIWKAAKPSLRWKDD